MEGIKTLIFLDLETTGLPHMETSPTKITEIALVAVAREHILEKHKGLSKENNPTNDFIPRVLHKINFPIYPCKMIQPMASTVSGLTNENLEHQKPFDENIYKLMILFIERLEKPICLVAHNGNRFDFPLLQSELSRMKKTLSDDLLCTDSLPAFREVLSNQLKTDCSCSQGDSILLDIKPLNNTDKTSSALEKCDWANEEYDVELAQAAELAEKLTREHSSFNVEELEVKMKLEMERLRKSNERTPIRKPRKQVLEQPKKEHSARRKLMSDKQQKYNMKSLYEHLIGKELSNAHRAEVDALALLECVTAIGRPILEWIDKNRVPFRSIKKMW